MTDLVVNVSKNISAPIDKVFDAWLSAETLAQFILPMPGMPNPKTENDPREGGRFVIKMRVGDDEIPHTGEYLQINRPSKLVFTWVSPFSTEGSTVTLNFKPIDDDTTHVELVHVKFLDEESRSNHEGGWSSILDKLNEVLN